MQPFWIDFEDRASACIEAKTKEEALALAAAFGKPKSADVLPYPRTPRLGAKSDCPSFCFGDLRDCLGRTACPRRHACDD